MSHRRRCCCTSCCNPYGNGRYGGYSNYGSYGYGGGWGLGILALIFLFGWGGCW